MALFFFDFDEREPDGQGTEFPDERSACLAAIAALPNIAADRRAELSAPEDLSVTVRNGGGQPIYRAVLTITVKRLGVGPEPSDPRPT